MRLFLIVSLIFGILLCHENYGKHQKISRYGYRAIMKLKRSNLEKMVDIKKNGVAKITQQACKEPPQKIQLKLLIRETFYLPYYDVLTRHCYLKINGWDGTIFFKEQR